MMGARRAGFLGTVLLAAGASAQWTQFRGPNGTGIDSAGGYPTEFSPTKNVVWKTAVPFGQSSPVIAGGRIYLTARDGDKLATIAIDARTGTEAWRKTVRREHENALFRANDPASPTPAADESGVYVFFADYGLIAYAPDGKERWSVKLGPFRNFYGMASSPILVDDLVVLLCDQQTDSFLMAVDRKNGRQRWKTQRLGMTIGWATPMIFRPSKAPAGIVVLGSTRLDSYSILTGERQWFTPVGSMGALGVPAASGDTLFIATPGSTEPWMPPFEGMLAKYDKDKDGRLSFEEFRGDPDLGEHFGWIDENGDKFITAQEWNTARSMGDGPFGAVAIRPDKAQGRLPNSAIKWRYQKGMPMIAAPLLYQNVYYMVKDGGVITALDAASGKMLKQGRSPQALGDYYASPVAADGKIFLASSEGKMTVIKAGAELEVLAVNDMGEDVHATPALAEGRIYVRTHDALYCFGAGR